MRAVQCRYRPLLVGTATIPPQLDQRAIGGSRSRRIPHHVGAIVTDKVVIVSTVTDKLPPLIMVATLTRPGLDFRAIGRAGPVVVHTQTAAGIDDVIPRRGRDTTLSYYMN